MKPDQFTELQVESTETRLRLDAHLRRLFPGVSRGAFQRLIEQGHLLVDGRPVKSSHYPRRGERITIRWPEPTPASAQPEAIPLEVLYEDEHLVVVNKRAGIVVHPAAGHVGGTLVNALLHHCGAALSGIGGVARPGIVHRLDKDTSGCLVVAKNDAAHLALSGQFAGREVEKVYVAVVCGSGLPATGEIRAAVARHPSHRKRMAVSDGSGREAWTTYRVLESLRDAALVEAQIHTGRTHQIRVHFKHIGHPLVGDATYGRRANQRLSEETGYHAPRQLLHAFRLVVTHPVSGKSMRFEAPWPGDLKEALAALRMDSRPS
jgi:23S rRNA pseudouridine1911/1915/1917 synthase